MKKALIFLSAMMILSQPSLMSKERPIEFDDLLKMRTIKHMTPSPNGKYVAYTLYDIDRENNDTNSSIWMTDLGTGESKQLTRSGGSDRSPCWSPDGHKLAFISKRSEKNQIWILDMDGGEAEKLTDISTGAGRVLWSPEGSRLVFTSHVFPECPDDDCNRSRSHTGVSGCASGIPVGTCFCRLHPRWKTHRFSVQHGLATRCQHKHRPVPCEY
jgi:dipeptidyl aminopeptidase/acylaminoacyl peptidase